MRKPALMSAMLLIVLCAVPGANRFAAAATDAPTPQWSQSIIAEMVVDGQLVSFGGSDLLRVMHPAPESLFHQLMGDRGDYGDYLKDQEFTSLTQLQLNAILDQRAKALGFKFKRLGFKARLAYIEKLKLIQAAAKANKDVSTFSYADLRDFFGDNEVQIKVNWTECRGSVQTLCELMDSDFDSMGFEWPPVTVHFDKLPEAQADYEKQILTSLLQTYREMTRLNAWKSFLREVPATVTILDSEARQFYDRVKDEFFVQSPATADKPAVYLPFESPDVHAGVVKTLSQREEDLLWREEIRTLLSRSPITVRAPFCQDSNWPCPSLTVDAEVALLMPERQSKSGELVEVSETTLFKTFDLLEVSDSSILDQVHI